MHTFKKQTVQEKIWRYLRNKRSGRLEDVLLAIAAPGETVQRKTVLNYLIRLINSGFVEKKRDIYFLAKDCGPVPPRTDHKATGVKDPKPIKTAGYRKACRWEYRLSENLTIAELNQAGGEGWELAAISGERCFYLKRALEGEL